MVYRLVIKKNEIINPMSFRVCRTYKNRKELHDQKIYEYGKQLEEIKLFSVCNNYKINKINKLDDNKMLHIKHNFQKKMIDCMLNAEDIDELSYCDYAEDEKEYVIFHKRRVSKISVLAKREISTNLIQIVCGLLKIKSDQEAEEDTEEENILRSNIIFTHKNRLDKYKKECDKLKLKYIIIKDLRDIRKFVYYLHKFGSRPSCPKNYNNVDVILIKDGRVNCSFRDHQFKEKYVKGSDYNIYNIIVNALTFNTGHATHYTVKGRIFIDIHDINSSYGVIKYIRTLKKNRDEISGLSYPKCDQLWIIVSDTVYTKKLTRKYNNSDGFPSVNDTLTYECKITQDQKIKGYNYNVFTYPNKNIIRDPIKAMYNFYILKSVYLDYTYLHSHICKNMVSINFFYHVHENPINTDLSYKINNSRISNSHRWVMKDYFIQKDYTHMYSIISTALESITSPIINYKHDISVKSIFDIIKKVSCFDTQDVILYKELATKNLCNPGHQMNKILKRLDKAIASINEKCNEHCPICFEDENKNIMTSVSSGCKCKTSFCSINCCLRGCNIIKKIVNNGDLIMDLNSGKCPICRGKVHIHNLRHFDKDYKDTEEYTLLKVLNESTDYKSRLNHLHSLIINNTTIKPIKKIIDTFHKLFSWVYYDNCKFKKKLSTLKYIQHNSQDMKFNRQNDILYKGTRKGMDQDRKCGYLLIVTDKKVVKKDKDMNVMIVNPYKNTNKISIISKEELIKKLNKNKHMRPELISTVIIYSSKKDRSLLSLSRHIDRLIINTLQTMDRKIQLNIHHLIYKEELGYLMQ